MTAKRPDGHGVVLPSIDAIGRSEHHRAPFNFSVGLRTTTGDKTLAMNPGEVGWYSRFLILIWMSIGFCGLTAVDASSSSSEASIATFTAENYGFDGPAVHALRHNYRPARQSRP
jgi:hypothetical protein